MSINLNSYIENEQRRLNAKESVEYIFEVGVFSMDTLWENENISICLHPFWANCDKEQDFHKHDYFELVYMYRGTAQSLFKNEAKTLKQGDLLLMNLNTYHGCKVDSENSILINIMIRSEFLKEHFLPLLSENDLFYSFFMESLFIGSKNEQYLFFEKDESQIIDILINNFLTEYFEKKACYKTSMHSYLCLIFTELLRTHINRVEYYEDNMFAQIYRYMNENLSTISLTSLSEHFHYSPVYLSKLIKRYSNHTFSEIVIEIKFEKAAAYLSNTTLSIETISELLGFYDRSYFNKSFKKYYGLTPNEYRLKKRKNTNQ